MTDRPDDETAENPPFTVATETMAVLEQLWSAGHGAYLVGGGVRDALLGLPVSDWDIATDARPERILQVFPGSSYENRFGTVLARGTEITTFRRDHRYADHRRPDLVTFSSDVFEDLARRDLTINAIAWGRRGPEAAARMVDPADGRGDLEARLVRAVGDPARRFDEDALRLLRAVRIAARLDFSIEPMTLAAMVAHAADVEWVSEERAGSEIRRMLTAAGPSRAIELLAQTGILDGVLPELAALPAAALERTCAILDAVTDVEPGHERLALAGLFAETRSEVAQAALERLRVAGAEAEAVAALVAAAALPCGTACSDPEVRRFMRQVPRELLAELLTLRAARAAAVSASDPEAPAREAALRARVEAQIAAAAPLTLADLAVDGHDLRETLGLPEGPLVGRLLERLLSDVIDDPAINTRSVLLTRASLALDEIVRPASRRGRTPRAPIG